MSEETPQPGDVVFVRGKGGAVNKVTVPSGGIPLERFTEALDRGDLSIVPDHFVEETTSRQGGLIYKIAGAPAKVRPVEEAPAPVEDSQADTEVKKPGKSASVEAWRAYAVAQGMDPDAAAAADKAALVEQFGS